MKAVIQYSKTLGRRALLKLLKFLGNRKGYYLFGSNSVSSKGYRFEHQILNKNESWFENFEERWLYSVDSVRYATLELLRREIYENALEGAVAEVGVYKGVFSSVINYYFPDKQLYLFDTFEGFDSRDVQVDNQMGYSPASTDDFNDSNIELVMSRMFHQDKIVLKKGWFPESASGCENEKFCFVSLDTDLYQPIYSGLCWFYPRLVNGGYIMVNDYNIDNYQGTKKAVHEFTRENGISYTPICDLGGSVLLGKPLNLLE